MKAPFTELYGTYWFPTKDQFGFIKSLSYTVNENGDWDFARSLPRLFDMAIGYQILSKKPPQLGGDKLYRIKVERIIFIMSRYDEVKIITDKKISRLGTVDFQKFEEKNTDILLITAQRVIGVT